MSTGKVEQVANEGDVVMATEAVHGPLFKGMSSYIPVPDDLSTLRSPAVIAGTDFHQMLQISLAPGDVMTTEPGSMVMMSGSLEPSVDIGDCTNALKRCCCAGESFFRLVFENKTQAPQFLAVAPPRPGKIIPLPLEKWAGVTLSRGVFLGAYGKDWRYELKLVGNLGTACCGGQGLILPCLTGTGTAFISASGAVEVIDLQAGEQIVVDQANLVAFSKEAKFDVRMVPCGLTCCCGGMGLFNALFTGPGTVIVESLPMQKLAAALLIAANQGGKGGGGGD